MIRCARNWMHDRVTLALAGVFVLIATLYLVRAAYTSHLSLYGGSSGPYNQLADAFLHLHLWVGHFTTATLGPDPHAMKAPHPPPWRFDYALSGHYLYITWGPAPALVWLVPLHLLGFEPSASAIVAPFAVVGTGFALATLRVILRQIGEVPLWASMLAALTLALASAVPCVVTYTSVYYQAVAGGYCFAMGGLWLALSAIAAREASLVRLALMSLCFGLATASRPTLGLTALLLVPVYLALRPARPRRGLLVALAAPVLACFVLLGAYNQVRFGDPLENGFGYQLNTAYDLHRGELSYLTPGLWSYLLTPPRPLGHYPYLSVVHPQGSYPLRLPAAWAEFAEPTGGLLPMAPIVFFLLALPWVWRRRPQLLGALGSPLLLMAGVGLAVLLFLSFEFFGTAERYEVDYTSLLLFGAIAVWLALCAATRGAQRRALLLGGGLLAAWSCLMAWAIAIV